MQKIRCFIAIPIEPQVRDGAKKLVQRISQPGDGIKWVPNEHLHLTLKFLGDVHNTEVPQVCQAVRACCQKVPPLSLNFLGTGGFPDAQRPRVVWAGVSGDSMQLTDLVEDLERQLADLGFKPEPRDYRPHLTLGRTRSGSRCATPEMADRIAENKDFQVGHMQADKVCLMASFLDKRGPSYQVMDTIPLSDPAA